MVYSGWSEEKTYYQKEDYFADLLSSINSSTESVELETYIFDCDLVGQAVLASLKEASSRGVQVFLTIDGVGAFFWLSEIKEAVSNTAIKLKIYHPLLLFRSFSKLNKRLHRKICIIDKKVAFIGSFNITNESNRDTGVRLRDINIEALRKNSLVRLNETKSLRKKNNHDLAKRIRSVKKRVWITNAYFVPPLFILRALCTAGKSGADVRILLSERSDFIVMKKLAETYYSVLLQSHVQIFEYKNKFLHAKTMLLDDWIMVGTSNFNHRSVLHDLEIDVVLTKPSSLQSLEHQYLEDLSHSNEITMAHLAKFTILNKVIGWLLQVFRYWL
jgi:cardiolipin synthase